MPSSGTSPSSYSTVNRSKRLFGLFTGSRLNTRQCYTERALSQPEPAECARALSSPHGGPVIAQETLDRVRRDANVVEIVGESVKLTKRGRSFVGLCPFHKEKTPSFHVNAERGFYHCFGCQASGDAIKFLQETEGLDFIEAVRRLAERMGIDIVETASDVERRQYAEVRRRQQELYDVSNAAAAFFERMLREHPLSDVA